MARGFPTLRPEASFWVAAAVVVHTIWTSAAPAMTYPLYAADWGLAPTTTAAIFAIYPIVVVAVLIGFGDISDYLGRRTAILAGLACSLVGVLLFAAAPDVAWLFAGRIFMGAGVGLSAGPATAAMVEFSPPRQIARAGVVTAAAQAVGLSAATVIGGGLIQYAPLPTRLNFWLLFVLVAALLVAAWFLPAHTRGEARGRWRPSAPTIAKGVRRVFVVSATAAATAYMLGAIMLSLGAQIARDLIGSNNSLVNGTAIALFAIVWGLTGVLCKRLPSASAMMLGGLASAAGIGLLVLAAAQHDLSLFLGAVATTGVAYSLLFMGGLNLVNARAPMHHRGGTLSALFLVAYLAQGTIALVMGAIVRAAGLETSIEVGAIVIAAFSVAVIPLVLAFGRSTAGRGEAAAHVPAAGD